MLCYEYPPVGGGGAKVVHGLTHELSRKDCEIDLVTMGFKNLPAFEKIGNLNIHRIKCIRLKRNVCTYPEMILYIILAVPKILKLCKKNKYQINHTHFIFPDGILASVAKMLKGLPYIVTAHGSDVPGYNPDRFKLLHKFLLPIWKFVTSNSEKIILPSKNLEVLVKKINPKLRTAIIPNGIELDKFSSNVMKKKQILIVTRMFKRKGVQYFLEAVKEIKHDYTVNIVGDGPYLETLKNISGENNLKINFLGYIDNLSDQLKRLYEESEIFVFTSESENFPVVLLEAMLSGLAIITTNDNGCAEVVGDSAILIESKSSKAIKDSLLRLINDTKLTRDLQLAARKRVVDKFSWEFISQKYIDLYSGITSTLKLYDFSECYIKQN
jgi:glycosyltransferase involved in cell wall biosynthesis